jgi:hypothetical protein
MKEMQNKLKEMIGNKQTDGIDDLMSIFSSSPAYIFTPRLHNFPRWYSQTNLGFALDDINLL